MLQNIFLNRLLRNNQDICKWNRLWTKQLSADSTRKSASDEEFEEVVIPGLKKRVFVPRPRPPPVTALQRNMRFEFEPDLKWVDMWPGASTFAPGTAPFPLHMGYVKNLAQNKGVSPHKFANTELMKIPNFLHLTPAHVRQHCKALKPYCTKWPSELNTKEIMDKYFPVEVKQCDFVFTGKSLRDKRARWVTLKVPLSVLHLDDHARHKMLLLVGREGYLPDEDCLYLKSGRCPSKQQNYDYLVYVLTALTHESKTVERWERLPQTAKDWDKFYWEKSKAKKRMMRFMRVLHEAEGGEAEFEEEEVLQRPEMQRYVRAVSDVHDKTATSTETLEQYKVAVSELFFKKQVESDSKS